MSDHSTIGLSTKRSPQLADGGQLDVGPLLPLLTWPPPVGNTLPALRTRRDDGRQAIRPRASSVWDHSLRRCPLREPGYAGCLEAKYG
jgi:hypothetical protein